MGKSIFKGWRDDNDPLYTNNQCSVIVGSSFSLAGRPQKVDKPPTEEVTEKVPSEEKNQTGLTETET